MYKLKEMGILHKLTIKYFGSNLERYGNANLEASTLGFDNLFFPGAVVIMGIVIAISFLIGEAGGAWLTRKEGGKENKAWTAK